MKRFLRTCTAVVVAVMALAATGAGSALATPKTLTLEANGEPLAPGAQIDVSSSNFLVHTESGDGTCQDTSFGGLLANSEPKIDTMEISEAVFAGEPANEGKCTSTLPKPLREVNVTATSTSLPWTFILTNKGQLTIKSEVVLRIEPPNPPQHPPATCILRTSGFRNGSFPTNGDPLSVTFTNVKAVKGANSGAECRTHPVISMTLAFTSGGQPVTAILH